MKECWIKPRERKPLAEIICHKCEKKGHIARNCPAKSLRVKEELEQVLLFGEGEVNGQPVQRIQIDSGASGTVVDRRLVPVKDIGDETITVTFGNGTSGEYPFASVRVTFDGDEYEVKAAVVQGLAEDVLLGRDVPLHKHMVSRLPRGEQMDLLRQLAEKHHVQIQETKEEETAMAVMTRSQKQRMDQQLAETFIPQGGDQETPDESNETADHIGEEFPFEEDLFEPTTRTKTHQTRAERREHNLRWNKMQNVSSTMQLKTEQEKDPSVQKWLQQEDPSRVVRKEGVLCRVWTPRHSPGTTYEQIVLPKPYHSKVIQLAHDLPFAGHLGREKTAQRILRRFYWPTLFHDVKEYCQTCEECQVHGSHRSKAPMISLPTIGEPFKRIAMDVVGPLPRTSRGNRFILVVSDYATRYPEAIPLRNVTAKTVAEVLIDLFARYGIPEEILTDQGANFTSALLGELYRLIGVKAIKTSPYHPQTDGLVERFNRTLKSMLRKVLDGEKRNWDRMLPYVLFAYREVPQATLGFSPFELLYGRDVRGPLDVLKEEWIQNPESETDVLSFVMEVKDRMELAKEVVEQNAKIAKAKQKEYYDQKAREINLNVGDKVLLLLPTSKKKFVAKWQGPYTVLRRVGKVNYEIEMPDKGGRKQVFHVNHLSKWKERSCQVNAVIEDGDGLEEHQWTNTTGDIQFGEQVPESRRREIHSVLSKFPQVTGNAPGRTNKITHRIRTADCTPIRQKPYRLPQAYQEKVNKELEEMERHGIIEKSNSEWASPLVIVTKKDGGIRLCVDYRQLNQVTKFDAYPMPRIEELLDNIGSAEFVTTLDLAKGYWQVPLEPEDRDKTAFTSPRGLYQFTTMPFGLSGAPATFQRLMDDVLRGTESFAGVYLDDIVIHSSSWRNHLKHLEEVFRRLAAAGLTIKQSKCIFASRDCTYLGYRIGRGGVRSEKSKVQAIADMMRPQTKKDVRTFLGMTGYYRRFIRDYATIAEPLTDLTKKTLPEKIVWNERLKLAFQRLKKVLMTAPLMKNPDFTRTFVLQTDASGVGVGAVLSQGEEEDQPIAYFSRKLLPREKSYSTVEKECLAIVLAVKNFKAYLLGRSFIVQTDHRALQWLNQFKEKNTRLTRWSLILQPYNFIVQHRRGQANANADALSRLDRSSTSCKRRREEMWKSDLSMPSIYQ